MPTFTIGEVAKRSGFTASSLRYYEEHGLLAQTARTPAGYRIYDEAVLTRLKLIRRAKELGCSLDEIAELAELVESERCEPVQKRLHEMVSARITNASRRRAEVGEFIEQLRAAAARLGEIPVEGGCEDGCACMAPAPDIACTLADAEVPSRVRDWQEVLGEVVAREWTPGGALRLTFSDAVELAGLASLAKAEQACCAFFSFAVTIDGRGIALEVSAPLDGRDVLVSLFGQPT